MTYNVVGIPELRIFHGIFAARDLNALVMFDEIKGLSWVSQSLRDHTAHFQPF